MPDALKVATLLPTLKKSDADFEQFQNFRPISNLKVVSKLVEKAVTIQLTDHVMALHLDDTFQSASPGPCVIPWAFHEHFSFLEEI